MIKRVKENITCFFKREGNSSLTKTPGKASSTAFFKSKPSSAEENITFLNHTTSDKSTRVRQNVPLAWILLRTFYPELLYLNLVRLVGDIIEFGNPALLG